MFEKYFGKFLVMLLAWVLGTLFLAGWIFAFIPEQYILSIAITTLIAIIIAASYSTFRELIKKYQQDLDEEKKKKNAANEELDILKKSIKEKSSGFPTLLQYIDAYEKVRDDYLAEYLTQKKNPAYKAAEIVKEEAGRRREAEFLYKKTQAIIDYYESIAPFLLDFKEDIIEDEETAFKEFTQEEKEDPASNYLTKEEYRKLSTSDKNQLALDRYWKRPKSKWLLGRMYERYIGYLYEKKGYAVEYHGIFQGFEDLGRDLICQKGNDIQIVQCKNWSHFKTIHEKHIFQLFGTFFQYRDENPGLKINAVFYTTTKLSDLARRFAKELDIELIENCKMDTGYPCIKCNIGKNKEKIYHLPFDQQYDNTQIEIRKGEFYCSSVAEAEKAGFRRAYR